MELELIRRADPQVAEAMELELNRQRTHIELIASENFVSPAVMAAMGTCLTNKYAEGYPGKRYYGGCEYVDIVRIWRETGPVSSLAPIMPTSSLTAAPRPILLFTLRC